MDHGTLCEDLETADAVEVKPHMRSARVIKGLVEHTDVVLDLQVLTDARPRGC